MKKHLLMIATVPSMIGQFNMDNLDILETLGFQVSVATNFNDASVWNPEQSSQFRRRLEERGIYCYQVDFSRNPYSISEHLIAYVELQELLNRLKIDAIHTHTPIASALVRAIAHKKEIPVIYTAHGFHFYAGSPIRNWIIYYPIELLLSHWTKVLITINEEDYKRASKRFGAGEIVKIPGIGINTGKFERNNYDKEEERRQFGFNNSDFIFLSIGELAERKNHITAIKAFAKLNANGLLDNIKYLIAGRGKLDTKLRELIEEEGLNDVVLLLGYREDTERLYSISDCFIHPSLREGLGIAPLEAMAAGLPLISSNIGGIRDYTKDGMTGCSVNPLKVDDICEAIIKMKRDRSFRDHCKIINREIASIYDMRETRMIMKKIYQELLETGTKSDLR